jgi:hypothetical protein
MTGFIFGTLGYFWAVFVEMKVYNWFMPSAFGLPYLTYAQVGGITLLFGLTTRAIRGDDMDVKTDEEKNNKMIFMALYWTMGLGIAYLWKLAL